MRRLSTWLERALVSGLLGIAASCSEFDEPKPQDASPIYGCYVAPEAPTLKIARRGITIGVRGEPFPFHYEFRTSGAVLNVHMRVEEAKPEGLRFLVSKEAHLYRVTHTGKGPIVTLIVLPDGGTLTYHPTFARACEL